MKIYTTITCLLLIASLKSVAQLTTLKSSIETLCKTKKATIGVALYDFEKGDTLSIRGDELFPMQSVFKFHIALTILKQVEEGRLSLEKKISISEKELLPKTWSPLRVDYPNGTELSIKEIMRYMVSQSDNNACDILLHQLGGTAVVNNYIHGLGVKDFSIQANEEEMSRAWDIQFKNWTTPKAAIIMLVWLNTSRSMSQNNNYQLLYNMMLGTTTCPNRLKKGVPANARLAHKTGTSDTNKEGITAAVNDIGFVELANGKRFAISVFVSNSSENMETNEKIIADIAKLAADYFSK